MAFSSARFNENAVPPRSGLFIRGRHAWETTVGVLESDMCTFQLRKDAHPVVISQLPSQNGRHSTVQCCYENLTLPLRGFAVELRQLERILIAHLYGKDGD